MPKFTIRVEVKNLHSYTGEFANEQEAYDYAYLMNSEHDVGTVDDWTWDDGIFEIYLIEEDTPNG